MVQFSKWMVFVHFAINWCCNLWCVQTFLYFYASIFLRMKTTICFILVFLAISTRAQLDTIFKLDGEILPITVLEVNEKSVKFTYPGESIPQTISGNTISRIHFRSGRKQEFSSSLNVSRIKGCKDWEKVQISRLESEISGLHKIDMIGAKAKGVTTLSSLAKLQDRAYNKMKIETAMLGGNVAYILEQNTEEAVYGGDNASSKTPGVTVSGLAYTSRKVKGNEIAEGKYNITSIYVLQANEMEMEPRRVNQESVSVQKELIRNENGFQRIKLNISQLNDLKDYTIIYADDKEIVLSGLYSSRQGKKRYYNVYLLKSL